MTLQIELTWLLGAIFTSSLAIIGFLYKQIESLKTEQRLRFAEQERQRGEWQKAWTDLLEKHMVHEEKEFDRLRELQLSFVAIREKALKFVSQDDLERALAPLEEKIEKIERIVDARKARREDPVTGRPKD